MKPKLIILTIVLLLVGCFVSWFLYRWRDLSHLSDAKVPSEQRSTHKFLKDRVILLGTPIDAQTSRDVVDAIGVLNTRSSEQLTLAINSPGGAVESAWLIMEAIEKSHAPVRTLCLGKSGGVATLLLLSAKQKLGSADCIISFDEFSQGTQGDDLSAKEWRDRYIQHCAQKLPIDEKVLSDWCATNRTFTGAELGRLGIIEVVDLRF